MAITPLPDAPSRADPDNFATKGDAWVASLATFVTEANALEANVNSKEASATSAASSAQAFSSIADGHKNSAEVAANAAYNSEMAAHAFALQAGEAVDPPAIRLNAKTIRSSQAIPHGFNAESVGPIEIADGVEIEIDEDSTWSIV